MAGIMAGDDSESGTIAVGTMVILLLHWEAAPPLKLD